MKNIVVFLIGLFLIFLEAFFTNHISSFLSIDLLLIYIILISLYMDKSYALIEVNVASDAGPFKVKKLIVLFLVFVISIVYSIINAVVSAIFYVPVPLILVLLKGVILIPLLNVGVAFLAYSLFGDLLMKLREE